jgi:hypothetical protein
VTRSKLERKVGVVTLDASRAGGRAAGHRPALRKSARQPFPSFLSSPTFNRAPGGAATLGLIDENALSYKHGAPLELFQPGFEGKHGVRLGLR